MSRLSEEHDMTISDDNDLARLKEIGRIVANTLEAMGKALEPGMNTSELDRIGRELLEAAGARSAPELAYDFPGATCISVRNARATPRLNISSERCPHRIMGQSHRELKPGHPAGTKRTAITASARKCANRSMSRSVLLIG